MMSDWNNVRGQHFTDEEAEEASNFCEVLSTYGFLENSENMWGLFEMFEENKGEKMGIGKRLVLVQTLDVEHINTVLMLDQDDRIVNIAKQRIMEEIVNG